MQSWSNRKPESKSEKRPISWKTDSILKKPDHLKIQYRPKTNSNFPEKNSQVSNETRKKSKIDEWPSYVWGPILLSKPFLWRPKDSIWAAPKKSGFFICSLPLEIFYFFKCDILPNSKLSSWLSKTRCELRNIKSQITLPEGRQEITNDLTLIRKYSPNIEEIVDKVELIMVAVLGFYLCYAILIQ